MLLSGSIDRAVCLVSLLADLFGNLVETSEGGGDQTEDREGGAQRLADVLRVVLDTNKVGVVLDLDNLHAPAGLVLADKRQASLLELLDVGRVHLVTVSMAFIDHIGVAVHGPELAVFATRLEVRGPEAETHGAALGLLGALGHEDDDGVLSLCLELLGSGVGKSAHVARELANGQLHTEADTQPRGVVFSRPLRSLDDTLSGSLAEASRHNHTRGGANIVPGFVV